MDQRYLDAMKRFEGYANRAQWDYAQYSVGYGTRAKHAGEVITPEQAEERFRQEVDKASQLVAAFAPNLDAGAHAALTSLTYNAGKGWMGSGLGDAIRRGDLTEGQRIFLQYHKAGGEALPGLIARRMEEVTWFSQSLASHVDEAASHQVPVQTLSMKKDAPRTPAAKGASLFETEGAKDPAVLALAEQIKFDQLRMLTLRAPDGLRRNSAAGEAA